MPYKSKKGGKAAGTGAEGSGRAGLLSPLYGDGNTSRGLSEDTTETVGPVAGPTAGEKVTDPLGLNPVPHK